jgi:hypothetical protein
VDRPRPSARAIGEYFRTSPRHALNVELAREFGILEPGDCAECRAACDVCLRHEQAEDHERFDFIDQ